MSQNPLEQYFRQPKIYISLPSLGIYSPPGTYAGSVENMPVYSMTGMDEIIIKTPDALMSGECNIHVIESCCPTIKQARNICALDINVIFAAIRIATYGNNMTVTHTCTKCSNVNDYNVDLTTVIDFYTNKKYDNRVVVNDLVIKTQPTLFYQNMEFNIENYKLQQQLLQTEKIEDPTEKQNIINNLWKEFALGQYKFYKASVESIETPTTTVTERGHIEEWLSNCDIVVIDKIKTHLEQVKSQWDMPLFPVKCENCGYETKIKIDLDYSNFFSQA